MSDGKKICGTHAGEAVLWACAVCGRALCGSCGPIRWEEKIFCSGCARAREGRLAAEDARARRRETAAGALRAVAAALAVAAVFVLIDQGVGAWGRRRLAVRYASELPAAPDFEFEGPRGRIVSLSSLRGKVVILDFWAGWCEPCLRFIPDLKKLDARYGDEEFVLIGVNLDETRAAFEEAVRTHGVDWLQVWDQPGRRDAVGRLYGVGQIPAAVIIDKEGRIFKRWGQWDSKMSRFVDFLLAQPLEQ